MLVCYCVYLMGFDKFDIGIDIEWISISWKFVIIGNRDEFFG